MNRRWAAAVALTVLASAAVCAGVEWRERRRASGLRGDDATLFPHRRQKPYVMFGENVDPRWPPAPGAHRDYRIALIGGSSVAESVLAMAMEDDFRARGCDVTVYNLGVVSQASGQELAQLVFDVVDAKPDLVVFYDGGNDVMDPLYLDPRPGYPMDFLLAEHNPLAAPVSSYPTFALLAFGSAWARRRFPAYFRDELLDFTRLKRDAGVGTDEWREAIARSYVGHVAKAAAVARAFGIDFVAVFQPLVYFKTPLGPGETAVLERFPEWRPHAEDVRGRIFARVDELPPAARPRFLDYSRIFDGTRGDVFRDYIHVRPEFQAPLAKRLARDLAAGVPRLRAQRR